MNGTRAVILALALGAAAGCTPTVVEVSPDPEGIPIGSPVARGEEATGPIVQLASDRVSGIGWRYLIYPSGEDWCTQFETMQVAATACGQGLPDEGSTFGSVGESGDESALHPITGIVTAEVATVWLLNEETQERVPAKLIPLDEVGLEANAFIGFEPADFTVTHLQAVKFNGEILETYELP